MMLNNLSVRTSSGHPALAPIVKSNGHSVCDCSKPHKEVTQPSGRERNSKTHKRFTGYIHYREVGKRRRPMGRGPPSCVF